jgi:hypothetical protein
VTDLEREIRRAFADAGVHGRLHAMPLGGPAREVGVDPDEPVVMASVYKLPLLVAFCRRVDAGDLDPREQVTVDPDGRTAGPTGLSVMRDPVTMSWRDLACSMIAVSDNAAADVLLQRVGVEQVNETLSDLGLERTRVLGGTADVFRSLVADTAAADTAAAFRMLTSNDAAPAVGAYDAVLASATTARSRMVRPRGLAPAVPVRPRAARRAGLAAPAALGLPAGRRARRGQDRHARSRPERGRRGAVRRRAPRRGRRVHPGGPRRGDAAAGRRSDRPGRPARRHRPALRPALTPTGQGRPSNG